ncbi:MAG TPA: hypothetical protein VFE37_20860 [Chloroflexota bacterium]|nr:hypothetical protein [Chloroflexota bacterium]
MTQAARPRFAAALLALLENLPLREPGELNDGAAATPDSCG